MNPMKYVLLSTALTLSVLAHAQEPQAEREQLRAELESARAELAEAARRMARLQRRLVESDGSIEVMIEGARAGATGLVDIEALEGKNIETIVINDPVIRGKFPGLRAHEGRPRLGILVGADDDGYEILGVTPGSGAESAGLKRGDRVVAVNGRDVTGDDVTIPQALEGAEVGATVPVTVERDGEPIELQIETSAPDHSLRVFAHRFGDGGEAMAHSEALREGLEEMEREIIVMHERGDAPMVRFAPRLPGLFVLGGNSDLISNHEGLAPYFGTGEGVVVLRIDNDNPLTLADGDVVLSVDGEPIDRPVDLGRAMLEREPGETVVLEVMRNGVLTQLEGEVPQSMLPGPGGARKFGLWTPRGAAPEPPAAPVPPPAQL